MTQDKMLAVQRMAENVAAVMLERYKPRHPGLCGNGYARGIDFYAHSDLIKVIANILIVFERQSGLYPNLLAPELYSEKLNALKFLQRIKIPDSGNKLLTDRFITPEARTLVRVPEILWRSRTAILPPDDAVPAGEYFLKSNHGSGYCRRIRYPLNPQTRLRLEALAARWLESGYGLSLGEWWYNVFEKAIFIERCVTQRNPSAAVLVYTFRGRIGLISVDEKLMDGTDRTRVTLYDPSFRVLADQIPGSEPVTDFHLSRETRRRIIAAGEAIGRRFEAVRVDVIPGDDGELYLNEITLSSNAGLPLKSRQRDFNMGQMWGHCAFLDDIQSLPEARL